LAAVGLLPAVGWLLPVGIGPLGRKHGGRARLGLAARGVAGTDRTPAPARRRLEITGLDQSGRDVDAELESRDLCPRHVLGLTCGVEEGALEGQAPGRRIREWGRSAGLRWKVGGGWRRRRRGRTSVGAGCLGSPIYLGVRTEREVSISGDSFPQGNTGRSVHQWMCYCGYRPIA
jgi:hypothetical protein